MIICNTDNTEKIQIFLVRARSFIHLNEQHVLNGLYLNNTSIMVIVTNQVFLQGVHNKIFINANY